MDDKRPINEERAEAGEADASFKSSILINLGNSSDSPDHREKAIAFTYNTRSRTLLQDNTISHKQSVAKGDTSTVKVAQTSVKEAALAWNKGGNSVPNINDAQQRSHVGNSSHVGNGDTVSQATQNPQVPSNLNISGPTRNPPSAPRFTRPLRDLSLREGEKVILETVVTGDPQPFTSWYKDNRPVRPAHNISMATDGSTVSLTLHLAGQNDSATYKCVAENSAGRDQIKCRVNVTGDDKSSQIQPPTFVQELRDTVVTQGDDLELSVEIQGTQPYYLEWYHQNRLISLEDPDYIFLSHGRVRKLRVLEVYGDSEGNYACRVENCHGAGMSMCRVKVQERVNPENVQPINQRIKDVNQTDSQSALTTHPCACPSQAQPLDKQKPSGTKPSFVLQPRTVRAGRGQSAIFLCRTVGEPPPDVQWFHKGQIIHDSKKYKITKGDDNRLEVRNVLPKDSGTFTCTATNCHGNATADTELVMAGLETVAVPNQNEEDMSQDPRNTEDGHRPLEVQDTYATMEAVSLAPSLPSTQKSSLARIPDQRREELKKSLLKSLDAIATVPGEDESESPLKKESRSQSLPYTRSPNLQRRKMTGSKESAGEGDRHRVIAMDDNEASRGSKTKVENQSFDFRSLLKPSTATDRGANSPKTSRRASPVPSNHHPQSQVETTDFRNVLHPVTDKSLSTQSQNQKPDTCIPQVSLRHVMPPSVESENPSHKPDIPQVSLRHITPPSVDSKVTHSGKTCDAKSNRVLSDSSSQKQVQGHLLEGHREGSPLREMVSRYEHLEKAKTLSPKLPRREVTLANVRLRKTALKGDNSEGSPGSKQPDTKPHVTWAKESESKKSAVEKKSPSPFILAKNKGLSLNTTKHPEQREETDTIQENKTVVSPKVEKMLDKLDKTTQDVLDMTTRIISTNTSRTTPTSKSTGFRSRSPKDQESSFSAVPVVVGHKKSYNKTETNQTPPSRGTGTSPSSVTVSEVKKSLVDVAKGQGQSPKVTRRNNGQNEGTKGTSVAAIISQAESLTSQSREGGNSNSQTIPSSNKGTKSHKEEAKGPVAVQKDKIKDQNTLSQVSLSISPSGTSLRRDNLSEPQTEIPSQVVSPDASKATVDNHDGVVTAVPVILRKHKHRSGHSKENSPKDSLNTATNSIASQNVDHNGNHSNNMNMSNENISKRAMTTDSNNAMTTDNQSSNKATIYTSKDNDSIRIESVAGREKSKISSQPELDNYTPKIGTATKSDASQPQDKGERSYITRKKDSKDGSKDIDRDTTVSDRPEKSNVKVIDKSFEDKMAQLREKLAEVKERQENPVLSAVDDLSRETRDDKGKDMTKDMTGSCDLETVQSTTESGIFSEGQQICSSRNDSDWDSMELLSEEDKTPTDLTSMTEEQVAPYAYEGSREVTRVALVETQSTMIIDGAYKEQDTIDNTVQTVRERWGLKSSPVFHGCLEDREVKEGKSVTFEVKVTGLPKPEISWFLGSKMIKPSKYFTITYEADVARLQVTAAFPEDTGIYSCQATNSAGSEKVSCHLRVKEHHASRLTDVQEKENFSMKSQGQAPVMDSIDPHRLTVKCGDCMGILVTFTSDPKPKVTWKKDGKLLTEDDRMCFSQTETCVCLHVDDCQATDSGVYLVTMVNDHGSDTKLCTVSVESPPDPPHGRPYASEVTLTSVTLAWSGPAYDGGSQVTYYCVEMCEAETQEWTVVSDKCYSTSCHVTALKSFTPYFFRVRAINRHGTSLPSNTSDVVVTKDRKSSMRLSFDSDDVFSHSSVSTLSPFSPKDEEVLPFSPREVTLSSDRKFEEFYDKQEEIGKGKFGNVYLCQEKVTGQVWAAKVIKCRGKDKAAVIQEVNIMNQLRHPKLLLLKDAFESVRSMTLVMEYVEGGELFERVVDEDFDLTERDCVHFMHQICQGVQYMHDKHILHLDLKPENVLCCHHNSNLIKIIDFGLARIHTPGESLRALFGTPEFVAPEVVNFEQIGPPTDIWSLGVICYVLLSGLSPFMGDNDVETLTNVTRGDYDFDDEAFDEISRHAKDFIEKTLQKNPENRLTIEQCLSHKWLSRAERNSSKKLRQSLRNLKQFMARRKWQKMGTAIRALGRMASGHKLVTPSGGGALSTADVNGTAESSPAPSQSESSTPVGQRSRSHSHISDGEHSGRLSTSESETHVNVRVNVNVKDSGEGQGRMASGDKNSDNGVPGHSPSKLCGTGSSSAEPGTKSVCENSRNTKNSSPSKPRLPVVNQGNSHSLHFTKDMLDAETFLGDITRFDVSVASGSNVAPDDLCVTWLCEDEPVIEDDRHSLINPRPGQFSLILRRVSEGDEGEYWCRVKSSASGEEIVTSADLIVCNNPAHG